jgi:hypothetical protein
MAMAHSAQDLASRRGSVAAALVGVLLLEQQEEWQLDGRRVFSELSMAKLDKTSESVQDQSTAALAAAA